MSEVLKTLTEQDTDVLLAKALILGVLQPFFPEIKPANIEVVERTFASNLDAAFSALQSRMLGYECTPNVETTISFKDFELGWEQIKLLKEVLDAITNVSHSYNSKFICHHASAKSLAETDKNIIIKAIEVKAAIMRPQPSLAHEAAKSDDALISTSVSYELDEVEEMRLRLWAQRNYVPYKERDNLDWHPVILDEMRQEEQRRLNSPPQSPVPQL